MTEAPENTKQRQLELRVGALSVRGKVREENQDRMSRTQVPLGDLYIVADGMGGYKGGGTAAQITIETVERVLREAAAGTPPEEALRGAVDKANEAVHNERHSGKPEFDSMGSTALVLLVSEDLARIAHVGDSRAYLVRKGTLQGLTEDHTAVQRWIKDGKLTEEEARDHPDASRLTRAIGTEPAVEVDISNPLKLQVGDAILLCSDGLSGYVNDREIQEVVASRDQVQDIVQHLVDLAMDKGGEDNITVQYARLEERAREVMNMQSGRTQMISALAGAALGSLTAALVLSGFAAVYLSSHMIVSGTLVSAIEQAKEDEVKQNEVKAQAASVQLKADQDRIKDLTAQVAMLQAQLHPPRHPNPAPPPPSGGHLNPANQDSPTAPPKQVQ